MEVLRDSGDISITIDDKRLEEESTGGLDSTPLASNPRSVTAHHRLLSETSAGADLADTVSVDWLDLVWFDVIWLVDLIFPTVYIANQLRYSPTTAFFVPPAVTELAESVSADQFDLFVHLSDVVIFDVMWLVDLIFPTWWTASPVR